MAAFFDAARDSAGPARGERPASRSAFGPYGGRYVPETLIAALDELTAAWAEARDDPEFKAELGAAASRLHRPPDAALPRRPALRAGRHTAST